MPDTAPRRTVYRDAALADGRSDRLQVGMSVLIEGDRIAWIRPTDGEEDAEGTGDLEIVDAGGTTIVPGMVDGHSHLTMPGGSHWIERGDDPPEPWEALAAATWRGGELLGEPDAGALRDGGPADFSLVHGDPLSDPTALWRVWRVSWSADPVVV